MKEVEKGSYPLGKLLVSMMDEVNGCFFSGPLGKKSDEFACSEIRATERFRQKTNPCSCSGQQVEHRNAVTGERTFWVKGDSLISVAQHPRNALVFGAKIEKEVQGER